jgi:hypothetical protein
MDVNPISAPITVAPAATLAVEQSAAPPASDESRQRILERLLELSQPVPPPALWHRFGSSRFVRRLAGEPRDLLSQLVQDFTADQLLAAGVAVQTQSGDLEVSTLIATDEAFLIRGNATGRAAGDIVSHRGKLSNGTCEWCELAAQTTDANSEPEIPVVLCASDAELCVLVRLGISCTPLAGVDRLIDRQVRALFKKRAEPAQQRRYRLVLLGWQPETLSNEPSTKNLAAIRHVADIRRLYGFDPHILFSVWQPSGAELVNIRRAHSFVDHRIVAKEFKSSLQNSLVAPADALTLLADRQPTTWAKARAALESAIEGSTVVPRVAEASVALEKLERAYHQQVVRPLEAAVTKTGLEALLSLLAADLAKLWYQDLELVHAARRVIAGQFPSYAKRADDAALNRKLRLVSSIVKLARVKFNK